MENRCYKKWKYIAILCSKPYYKIRAVWAHTIIIKKKNKDKQFYNVIAKWVRKGLYCLASLELSTNSATAPKIESEWAHR